MNYAINVTLYVQANDPDEAMTHLQEELDAMCELDNQVLAVEYPPLYEVKEEE